MAESKFKTCYLFLIEGKNVKGNNTRHYQIAVNEFLKTLPDLFKSLINSDEEIKIELGVVDCEDDLPVHTCLKKVTFVPLDS